MEEKYADVINDLCVKYEKTTDIGFEMLKAIARAKKEEQEPEYTTDLELNMEELMKDYNEFLELAEDKANADGLVGIE
jgi:hypothetical protein